MQSNSSSADIVHDQEFIVSTMLSIQAGDGTSYYLRGVFYKEGTSNYCGITWNGSDWFSGPYSSNEGWKKFLKVTVSNNTWNGELKAKIDNEDSGCKDSGVYKFKIQRFNEGSGSSTFDDQNELSVNIVIPTSTPTPSLTPKPSPTSKPTPTPKATPTVKPQPINTNTPEVKNEKILGLEIAEEEESKEIDRGDPNDLLNIATKSSKFSQPNQKTIEQTPSVKSDNKKNPFVAVGGVFSLLSACGILVVRKFRPL